jgi:hypothetical protein
MGRDAVQNPTIVFKSTYVELNREFLNTECRR